MTEKGLNQQKWRESNMQQGRNEDANIFAIGR